MIVSGEPVARFVSERLGISLCPPYTAAGIERDGEIVAGCIFHCFEGPNVHATVAGKGWTREFLKAAGDYAFGQLGCLRVTFTTQDETVARLAERLGGKREGLLRDQFGEGRGGIVVGLLRSEYRYASLPGNRRG